MKILSYRLLNEANGLGGAFQVGSRNSGLLGAKLISQQRGQSTLSSNYFEKTITLNLSIYELPFSTNSIKVLDYTNALFAFINMFEKIVVDSDEHILVAFDTKEKTKRHLAFDGYKAGRAKMPDELASQFPLIDQYLDVMGITHYKQAGYEADDIIGTLANTSLYDVHIYSSDKDLLQLVRENVTVHLLKKGMKEVHDYTPALIEETYGLTGTDITYKELSLVTQGAVTGNYITPVLN